MATNPLLITLADLPIHRQMKLCKTLCVHIHIPDKLTCFNLVLVWPSGSFLTRLWVDLIYHDNVMKIENQIFFQWEWGSRWTWTLITCLNQLMKSICLVGWLDVLMHFETQHWNQGYAVLTDDKPMAHDLFCCCQFHDTIIIYFQYKVHLLR